MHYHNIFMHYRYVLYLLQCCVLVGLDWTKPIMQLYLHVHAFSCIRTFKFLFFYISCCWYFFYCLLLFLSFFLSFSLTLVALWHLSVSLLRPETLFILGHLLLLLHLTPLPLTSSSMMRRPNYTSLRTFHDETFIRNTKSFYQTSLILTCLLSSRVGVRSHYVVPRSRALS